jgi:uncharacterized protein
MKTFLFVCFLLVSLKLAAQDNNYQDSLWIIENYTKTEQLIAMRDGVKLFTSIYVPKDASEKHPFLFKRTPYSCAPYGKDFDDFWNSYLKYYLREGYIFVIQDVRGRWMSEGSYADVRPFNPDKKNKSDIDEASDTYDAVEWLLKNIPNNNGNVGVFGISYPGFYATMAAMSNHPAIKAASPQAPVTDWFRGDDWHHNGAFMLMDAFNFYSGFGKPRPKPTTVGPSPFTFSSTDNYKFYLETGAIKNFNEKYLHDSAVFWNEIFAHPNLDEWWKARNPINYLKDIKPATLVVGGLFDAEDCFGAWRLYEAIEEKSKGSNNRLVMGPWSHGQWAGKDGSHLGNIQFGDQTSLWFQNNIEIPFFNYHLKGKGSIAQLPEATIFFSGENAWKKLEQWPPTGSVDKTIYLQERGQLSWNKPSSSNASSEYVSDPAHPVPYTEDVHLSRTAEYMTDDQRFASRRTDVLTFETGVLKEDLTVAGTIKANLMISTSGTDADIVVKLIDVFPDDFTYPEKTDYPMGGYQMLVRGEVMRGKYRNSFEKPEAFSPGKVQSLNYELPDVAHTFKKGHKLMIQIQSSWFPLVDRNPQKFVNIYTASDSDYQKATIRVYHNAQNASGIALPVMEGQK